MVDSIPSLSSNEVSQKFFNISLIKDEDIIAIRNSILKQEQQKPFIEKFVNYAGYAVWDKAIIKNGTGTIQSKIEQRGDGKGKVVFIPLALDTQKRVNAILRVKIEGADTAFHVIYKWQYKKYGYKENKKFNNADKTALLFMGFESYVFGHKDFKINDSLLLKGIRISDTIHIESFNKNATEKMMRMEELHIHVCYTYNCLARLVSFGYCEQCDDYYIWVDDGFGDGSGGGGGGTSGGGGDGDDGGWNDHPCNPSAGNPNIPPARIGQLAPCDGGGGDPWVPVPPVLPDDPDPCDVVQPFADKATLISKDLHFSQAKNDIQAVAVDGQEHAVVFGKDTQGNISSSPMSNGNESSGTVDTDWPGGFADLHNHPEDLPPSAGDLYGLISVDQNHLGYDTRYVTTPNGSVYALVITDLAKANAFDQAHPKVEIVNPLGGHYPPDFPDPLFTDFDNARTYFEYNGFSHLIAEEKAMALVLDKYNSGIALFKQDSNGDFKKLGTTEATNSDGIKTYTTNNCP